MNRITLALTLLLILPAACRKKVETPEQPVPVQVMCTECRKQTTLQLSRYVDHETWPKPCESCRKPGAFPYAICVNCSEPVFMRDASTGGFGYPARCPKCKGKWEH